MSTLDSTLLHKNIMQCFLGYRLWGDRVFHKADKLKTSFNFNHLIDTWEINNMPPKKRSANSAYGITWVRVDFDKQEEVDFRAWFKAGNFDLGELMTLLFNNGDKLTMSYNMGQDSYYVTIMGTENSAHNMGKGFSGWAKDPLTALTVVLYKYHYLIEGNMGNAGSSADDSDFG